MAVFFRDRFLVFPFLFYLFADRGGSCTTDNVSYRQILVVTDGKELEGACEALAILFDKRRAFYRHAGVPGGSVAAGGGGAEGAELLSVLSEEDWRAGVGFADWVGGMVWFGLGWVGKVWVAGCGLVWSNMICVELSGFIWFHLVSAALLCFALLGLAWLGLAWLRLVLCFAWLCFAFALVALVALVPLVALIWLALI